MQARLLYRAFFMTTGLPYPNRGMGKTILLCYKSIQYLLQLCNVFLTMRIKQDRAETEKPGESRYSNQLNFYYYGIFRNNTSR